MALLTKNSAEYDPLFQGCAEFGRGHFESVPQNVYLSPRACQASGSEIWLGM